MTSSSVLEVVGSDDLLLGILLRLPAKPLTRLKLVSKRWESLINTHHASHLRKQGPLGLICPDQRIPFFDFVPLVAREPPFQALRFPSHEGSSTYSTYWISHACNGLLLCCNSNSNYYSCCVYNPTTKRFAMIPSPGGYGFMLGLSLAFDPAKSHSYKIVGIRRAPSVQYPFEKCVQIEIYSSESGAWGLSSCEQFISKARFSHGVYWNGSILWMDYSSEELLCFNPDREELAKVPLPPTLRGIGGQEVEKRVGYFGESRDHLHVIEVCRGVLNIHEMKKDYSEWFVKYRVDLGHLMTASNIVKYYRIFSLVRGDEDEKRCSFMFFVAGGKFMRCNVDHNTVENICGMDTVMQYHLPCSFHYIESLAKL